MKRFLVLMLLCVAILSLSSCEQTVEEPQIVDVSFGVKFVESGSMSRATADEVYQDFYEKYIVTKELVRKGYTLTIRDREGLPVANLNGTWDVTTIQLPEGIYRISGSSEGDYATVSLRFDEEIEIKSSGTINLTAQYSCFLLLFPTNGGVYSYKYVDLNEYTYEMPTIDDVSYMFATSKTYIKYVNYTDGVDTTTLRFDSDKFNFQIGNYYYFNIVTGTFTIPPMENGEI